MGKMRRQYGSLLFERTNRLLLGFREVYELRVAAAGIHSAEFVFKDGFR